jgi:hypothetical protein
VLRARPECKGKVGALGYGVPHRLHPAESLLREGQRRRVREGADRIGAVQGRRGTFMQDVVNVNPQGMAYEKSAKTVLWSTTEPMK